MSVVGRKVQDAIARGVRVMERAAVEKQYS